MNYLPDPLEAGSLIEQEDLTIAVLPEDRARFSLRVGLTDRDALGDHLSAFLPDQIGSRSPFWDGEVACLGPDDWIIRLPAKDADALSQKSKDVSSTIPHSLVEISARELTLAVSGYQAMELLTVGCPRDLRKLLPGKACRTLCFDVPVTLWCDDVKSYRLDVWRSFAPHLASLFSESANALAAEKRLQP